jgi:hypothetical protein
MTKEIWLKKAGDFCRLYQYDSTYPSTQMAKQYSEIRNVILNDRHHNPENTILKKFASDMKEWMTAVKNNTYNTRFNANAE